MADFRQEKLLQEYEFSRDLYSLALTMFDLLSHRKLKNHLRYLPYDKDWDNWMCAIRKDFPTLSPILKKMSCFYPSQRYNLALEALLDASVEAWYAYGDDDWLLKDPFLEAASELGKSQAGKFKKFLQESRKKRDDEEISKIW